MSHTHSVHSGNGHSSPTIPDPEVVTKPERRRFTADYKHRILQAADACTHAGEVGALLRREGLYSSHLTTWRQQRQRGEVQGLTPLKRGRKTDPHAAELARLHQENAQLKAQLDRAELIVDVQKKLSQLLGLPETRNGDST